MSVMIEDGVARDTNDVERIWRQRIRDAKADRRRLEPTWHSNLAFAAGKFWLKWNDQERRLQTPRDLEGQELYSADIITEFRTTALGELNSDDELPQLLLVRDDLPGEEYQQAVNRAVGYAWDHEWNADEALRWARQYCVDLGTSAIRMRFDKGKGPVVAKDVPYVDGKATFTHGAVADAYAEGRQVDFKDILEGRTCMDVLSAFNLLVPPGISDEDKFPWEIVLMPEPLEDVVDRYPAAAGLKEDTDIGSLMGVDTRLPTDGGAFDQQQAGSGKLRDHVWTYTCFERPTRKHPRGQVLVFAGKDQRLVHVETQLPYCRPNGEYHSGLVYFHWWRATGRFWSRALVEVMKDPQRLVNERKTQSMEIVRRGMPKVIVEEGSVRENPSGVPMEKVEIQKGAAQPVFHGGIGPGDWMYKDVEEARVDIEHASGIRGPSLGENPTGVTTYSQLALIGENDHVKRSPIIQDHQLSKARLIEFGVYDIRHYWPPDKRIILMSDEDDTARGEIFNASQLPPFFIVKVAKGAAKPKSQAAELKKIEDIAQFSLNAQMPLPVRWYFESVNAGQALPLPEQPAEEQHDKAELENHLMFAGRQVKVAYYDPADTHIPIHRSAQIQAEIAGDDETWNRIEDHVQAHLEAARLNASNVAQEIGPPPGTQPIADGQQQALDAQQQQQAIPEGTGLDQQQPDFGPAQAPAQAAPAGPQQ